MAPDRWDRIKQQFDSVLEVPPAEREAYLVRTCGGDVGLKDEVERLLREFDQAGDFLAQPMVQRAYSLAPGEVIADRYAITRLIGTGGMGEVYEAQDQLLNESIALKTLRADLARSATVVTHFQKEIQLARKVTHSSVCRIFEAGIHEFADPARPPLRFFTMELLPGETLKSRIRHSRRLSREVAFPIAIQIAEGLQAAHAAGIVHADLKSGNVILIPSASGDRAVITDFGLAHVAAVIDPTDETQTMSKPVDKVAGTVAYMSPEQMTGRPVTTSSDIYSFGIILFEMATGALPFDSRHLINAAVQRVTGEGITVRSLVPDVDDRWASAISRCLQSDPRRRFSSAGEIAEWFRAGAWRMPHLYWTRREWIRAVAATGVPLAAGIGYWVWSRRPYQPPPAARDWYTKGVAALYSMTYEAARKALEQAVSADPNYALAHASLARAYQELDYSDRAKDSMLRAMTLAQDSHLSTAGMRRLRATQLVISRDFDRAVPLVQQIEEAADAGEKPAAALEVGWLAQQREDTAGAAAAYSRAVNLAPTYAAAKLRLAFIQGRSGDTETALKTFSEAERLYSASSDHEGVTETLLQRATLLNLRSRWPEAMQVAGRAYALAQTVGNSYQQIRLQLLEGTVRRNLGETARARELTQQAIQAAVNQKMDNLATSGLVDLGNSYFGSGEHKVAEPIFRQALDLARRAKIRRQEARAQASLGSLCEQDQRPEEAKQFIEAALPFFRQAGYRREFIRSTIVLGASHEQLGEFDEGVRIMRESLPAAVQIQDRQTEGLVRERLAENLRGQGRWPEAVTELEKAVGILGAGGAEARLLCAELYWGVGRPEDADRSLAEVEKLLEKRPNSHLHFLLRIKQAEIAYQRGRMSDAASASMQALREAPSGGEGAEDKAKLTGALVSIRTRAGGGAELVSSTIASLDRGKLVLDAASARLAAATALVAAGDRSGAGKALRGALEFFEPRRIWESVWRCRVVAAQATQEPGEAESEMTKARAALGELRGIWPAETVTSYLARPDIRLLCKGVRI